MGTAAGTKVERNMQTNKNGMHTGTREALYKSKGNEVEMGVSTSAGAFIATKVEKKNMSTVVKYSHRDEVL